MKSNTHSLSLRLRKWIIAFAFAGFLVGLGIGAYVAHKQHTKSDNTAPEAISETQQE
ncbi:hypothetical protein [Pontibacter sp. HSC-36F09]|uniref:hypothetical protein n=1 Tax=Pontibacter sp. HSC-36F09 TaxID=2910966 RepID=UPI0020A025BA|nr:hypothetical protein [Pontibacter sp. HSC-36F09]MCP2042759.1 hypothetical protein [Pontibacter sp. HSC-36F09]